MKILPLLSIPLCAKAIPFDPSAFCDSAFDILDVCGSPSSADHPDTQTAAAAAPAAGGQPLFDQITGSINTLRTQLVSANDTLNTFEALSPIGILTALQIQTKIGDIGDTLTQGAQLASASAPLNDQQSNAISQQFLQLEPQLFSLLNNIVVHKPSFATAGLLVGDLTKTVEATLVQQRSLSAAFAQAIGSKLTSLFAGAAPIIARQIDEGRSHLNPLPYGSMTR